jgi:hypothetical protein
MLWKQLYLFFELLEQAHKGEKTEQGNEDTLGEDGKESAMKLSIFFPFITNNIHAIPSPLMQ